MRPLRRIVLLCALLSLLAAPLRPVRAGAAPLPAPNPILKQAIETARAAAPAAVRVKAFISVAESCAAVGRPDQARQALTYAEEAAFTPMGVANSSPVAVGKEWIKLGWPADALKLAARMPLAGDRLDLTIAAADALSAAGNEADARAALKAAMATYTPAVAPLLAVQALTAAASRSDAADAAPLLEQAARIAAGMPSRTRDRALTEIARAYGHIGDDAAATQTALRVGAPVAQAAATVATALELATHDPQAAVARVQQAASAARRADPQPLSQALADAARKAAQADHDSLARGLLGAAEKAAGGVSGDARQSLLRSVANLYGTLLGDWSQALRVAQDAGDAWTVRAARAQAVVQLADAGKTAQADALLRDAAADKVAYVGQQRLEGLAKAYLKIHPSADAGSVMSEQPKELRDQILAAGARRALAADDPAVALDWARRITFTGAREDVLYRSACGIVDKADAGGLAKAVTEARGVSALLRTDDHRYGLLFAIGLRYAAAGDTAALGGIIREFDKATKGGLQDSRSLARMAILEEKDGKPDQAHKHLAACLNILDTTSCASCRDDAIGNALTDLLNFGDQTLLDQMTKSGLAVGLPVPMIVTLLDEHPDLPADRRRLLLRTGLQSAGRERMHWSGAEHLGQVALAYHKCGVAPDTAELALLPKAPAPAPAVEAQAPAAEDRTDQPAYIVYFHRTGCAECRDVSKLLDRVLAKTRGVSVVKYELDPGNPVLKTTFLLNETLCTALHVPKADHQIVPSIFSSQDALIGSEITEKSLTGLIEAARGRPGPEQVYAIDAGKAEGRLRGRYSSLSLAVVMGAGLVDGINPCAFTVIIFFLSYLAFLGHNRREILAAGVFFTGANFLTYLAVGVFLTSFIQFGEARSAAFTRALYGVTAAIVLVAAVLSLRDAVRCLQGRPKEMTLVLPEKLQSAIRRHITSRARFGLTAGAMAFLGGLVALISFPCTGQFYYPTIVFALHNLPQFRWGALGWLLIYNLCFILPLVLVFLLVFFGVTSERITAVFRRNLATTKFAMAGVFTVLFALMLIQVF